MKEVEWHELTEEQRIKEVYSKYTIKDFWNWWEGSVMEVRIMDWKLIKEVADRFKLPYSASGVYVWTSEQLKNVIGYTRDKATMWFGINPRKKAYNKMGWKMYGGGDAFVESIDYIFIDIDRVFKKKTASNKELKNCDILANKILERLSEQGWNKNYAKICSGNGVQLLIKLDVPIKLPNMIFDNATKTYQYNGDFEIDKLLIKNGIGKQIRTFANKYKDELICEVDKSGFIMGKVAALPCTKNYKYDEYTWRGIIDLKDGENTGLTDYILSFTENIKQFKKQNVFSNAKLKRSNIMKPGKIRQNKLVKFMLTTELPEGERNNTIWMSLKILLRDSKINLNSKEFRKIHQELEAKHGILTLNLPDKKYSFNENVINNFCIRHCLPLIYELYPNRNVKLDMKLENLKWESKDFVTDTEELKTETDIFEDIDNFKPQLIEGDYNNIDRVSAFMNGCIQKYGEEKTKYYFDILFEKAFSFR